MFLLPVAIVCSMKNQTVYHRGAKYPVISQKEALKPPLKGTEVRRLVKKPMNFG